MSQKALRTKMLAYKDLSLNEDINSKDQISVYDIEKKDLICMAILGMGDNLRDGVTRTI